MINCDVCGVDIDLTPSKDECTVYCIDCLGDD